MRRWRVPGAEGWPVEYNEGAVEQAEQEHLQGERTMSLLEDS